MIIAKRQWVEEHMSIRLEKKIYNSSVLGSITTHLAITVKRESCNTRHIGGGVKKDIIKFCRAYSWARSIWSSGYSDDMIMKKAHAVYKSENNEKTFTLKYMWRELNDQAKWQRILEEDSKNKEAEDVLPLQLWNPSYEILWFEDNCNCFFHQILFIWRQL